MAKDKENDNPEEQDYNEEKVDKKPDHDDHDQEDKLKGKFENFHEDLEENEIKDAESACNVAQSNLEGAQNFADNKKDYWDKSETTLHEYEQIKYEISLKLCQGTTDLKSDITESKARFGEMDTLFASSITCIKDVAKKVLDIQTALDGLGNAIKDDCNKNELKEINKIQPPLNQRMRKLQRHVEEACDKASDNRSNAVKASGVKALLNIDSIESACGEVKVEVDEFKADVEANITKYAQQVVENKKAYEDAVNALCTAESSKEMAELLKQGLCNIRDYADPDCDRDARDIDDIVEDAEKNFELHTHDDKKKKR